ncbi:MAG: hypothetical protein QM725_04415 [Lacibacter sp.]
MDNKLTVNRYLIYSTLFIISSESFVLKAGFDLKLAYIIIALNFFLVLVTKPDKIVISKRIAIISILILFQGIISIFLFKNILQRIIFQVTGIFYVSGYFYFLFKYLDYPVKKIFTEYCRLAYFLSALGLFLYFLNFIFKLDLYYLLSRILPFGYGNESDYRLRSVLLEPAHFAGLVTPAFLFYLKKMKENKIKFIVIFAALILSFSSVGYLGILTSFFFAYKGSFFKFIKAVTIIFLFGLVAYTFSPDIKMRVDDTLSLVKSRQYDFTGLNLSTFALLSNFYVSTQVIKDSPVIGHGVGSHPISTEKYIKDVIVGANLENMGITSANEEDANSLLLRVMSEFGLIGLFLILYYILRFYTKDADYISLSILLYFFYKLLREGHYFSPEMYFFVIAYVRLNYETVLSKLQSFKPKLS